MAEKKVFIHSSAVVEEPSSVGAGTRIWHFCHVMAGAALGEDCILGQNGFVASGAVVGDRVKVQNNVSIYSGVILEDEVFVGPSVVFTNVKNPRSGYPRKDRYAETRVRRGATVGANATVVCGVTVGAYAVVGAGAVVTRDVPDHHVVVGSPARMFGVACSCGETLLRAEQAPEVPRRLSCEECRRSYEWSRDGLIETS